MSEACPVMWYQVFGRTMVCKDMEVALKVAHQDNLDGITMEGTQVNKKGVLKGGFYDVSRSVMGMPCNKCRTQRSMNAVNSLLGFLGVYSLLCLSLPVPSSMLGFPNRLP